MRYLHTKIFRRKGGVNTVGGEADDPLGLDVEGDSKFPEEQLMVRFTRP